MEINNKEMKTIIGGAISYSMINAISKAIATVYEFGRGVGSAIRRLIKKTYC